MPSITCMCNHCNVYVFCKYFYVLGIEVRTNDSSFFMHHKFAVADRKIVMTGSFNWSRNAMLGNHENVLFVKNPGIITQYQKEFERLWSSYKP